MPTESTVVVLEPDQRLDPVGALFFEVTNFACADLELTDQDGLPEPHLCTDLGSTRRGTDIVLFQPDPSWSGTVVRVVFAGSQAELVRFAVLGEPVDPDVHAMATSRTVSYDGLSQRVCREGPLAAVVRSDTQPTEHELLLTAEDEQIYDGVADGSWPEASPGTTATFWFRTWDRSGIPSPWLEDTVTLASQGMIRTDLRLGGGLEGACPPSNTPWTEGDEVLADGAEEPGTLPDPDDDEGSKGCSCSSSGGSGAGWLVLGGLALVRRRR